MRPPARNDGRRYSFAALAEALGQTEPATGRALGLSGTTLAKAREWGLTLDAAERYALRAGLHPFEVWPSMPGDRRRDQGAASARRRYRDDPEYRAGKVEANRRYKDECRSAVLATKRRYNGTERAKAAKRAWYEANKDAVNARRRARRSAA